MIQDKEQQQMIETGLRMEHLDREHDDEIPYSYDNQIDHLTENIKLYATLLLQEEAPTAEIEDFKSRIVDQIHILYSQEVHTHQIQNLQQNLSEAPDRKDHGDWIGYQKIEEFGRILKELMALRADTENEEDFVKTSKIIEGFLKEMQIIIEEDSYTISRIQNYDPYINNIDKSCQSNDRSIIQLRPDHYWKQQKIIFHPQLPPEVFTWVQPPLHKVYLSQVTQVYHEIVPFKIKYISLSSMDEPKIETPNYFKEEIESEKSLIIYCKPGTNILYSYQLSDICKALTIQKEYLLQRELPIPWKFSKYSQTVITPEGRIFAINCRATSTKIDSSMYEITQEKVSNKGRRPEPKYDSGFLYANKALYVIGGNNTTESCSKKNYKYSLREKKWKEIAESNVALRKPTVCTFRDRFIMKIGGINEFDYINKVIEIYDTETDKWSIVRASPKNVLEEIQILEDSLAAQIGEDQIYVFGGKNSNNYQKDTGFVLQIMEMKQKPNRPMKIASELWNVSLGKKNIYSFFGLFSQANVIAHNNCLYALRVSACKSLPN